MKPTQLISLLCVYFFFYLSFKTSAQCTSATTQSDLDANNIRARMLVGGDLWWDGNDGRYIAPKVEPGMPEVAAIFAGAFWMGGFDPGGNLKLSAQTYGFSNGSSDYWPGVLSEIGTVDMETCDNFDRQWSTSSADINAHLADLNDNGVIDGPIPQSILAWPGLNNPHFFDENGFELPLTSHDLAPFWDYNSNGMYDPANGDYPLIKGADQGIWWVFNDAGNIHTASQGDAFPIEVHVLAYAYSSANPNINNATFYDYKVISRTIEQVDSVYAGLWIDPDLGCYTDDYVGCDTSRNMAYLYNMDALDGESSCSDCFGVNTYCETIPMVGIKILEGMTGWENNQIVDKGLTNFINYGSDNPPLPGPSNASGFYNLLSGSWPDGTPLTQGGTGYNPGSTDYTSFAFPSAPDDSLGWSMCSENLSAGDRRMVMGSGPIQVLPGSIMRFSFAVIFVEDVPHPCPSLNALQEAADEVQELYDGIITSTEQLSRTPSNIKFSPNPMTEYGNLIFADFENEVREIEIYSMDGKLVRTYDEVKGSIQAVGREQLIGGVYFYKLLTTDFKIHSGKFIIQ